MGLGFFFFFFGTCRNALGKNKIKSVQWGKFKDVSAMQEEKASQLCEETAVQAAHTKLESVASQHCGQTQH